MALPYTFKPNKTSTMSTPDRQSMGIADDYAVRKNVATREATIGVLNEVIHVSEGGSIQAALDRLPSTGGQVFIDAGTYNVTTPIIINKARVTLMGEGKASIIKLANGANCNILEISGSDIPYITISNLMFDGNKANNVTGNCIYVNATNSVDDDYDIFENLYVYNAPESGFKSVYGPQELWISKCRFRNNLQYGINMSGYDNKIIGCVVSGSDRHGIMLNSDSGNIIIENCKVFGCASAGNTYANYYIASSDPIWATGCESQNSSYTGWYITTSTDPLGTVTLVNCSGCGNGTANTTYKYGVYIHNRDNVSIIGGQYSQEAALGHQSHGILIDGTSNYCIVSGVQATGNSTAQILDSSTGSNMILANVGYTADTLKDHSLAVASITTDHIGEKTASHGVVFDNDLYSDAKTIGVKSSGGVLRPYLTTAASLTAGDEQAILNLSAKVNGSNRVATIYNTTDPAYTAGSAIYMVPGMGDTRLYFGTSSTKFWSLNFSNVQNFENLPSSLGMQSSGTDGSSIINGPGGNITFNTNYLGGMIQNPVSINAPPSLIFGSNQKSTNTYYASEPWAFKFKTVANSTDLGSIPHTVWSIQNSIIMELDKTGIIKPAGGYKSSDGTAGKTDTISFETGTGTTINITVKDGLIAAWEEI